ncbi:hypothetical protein Tsubulata_023290 [Turnera subulata]|uniref:DUF4283 domain-containing protein n=1 Tax=Turnera subulata TaxID=218843 RepID=A0A9Q0JBT3_9ROSI|nr:hypothetical protein Tsubulata_023290 [Turnera subulata]
MPSDFAHARAPSPTKNLAATKWPIRELPNNRNPFFKSRWYSRVSVRFQYRFPPFYLFQFSLAGWRMDMRMAPQQLVLITAKRSCGNPTRTTTATRSRGLFDFGGQVMDREGVQLQSFHADSLIPVGQCVRGVQISELDKNLFMFRFKDTKDKMRVLAGEPWHFDRQIVVLRPVEEYCWKPLKRTLAIEETPERKEP